MYDLSRHPYFTEYTDEKSGVKSYVLTKRVAEVQKQFYFAQSSITQSGKYLWLLCMNPPARYYTLAVVSLDPDNPFIRHFPNASPDMTGFPGLANDSDDVFFGCYDSIYRMSVDGELTRVIHLSPEFLHKRPIEHLISHASISADNKYILLDMQIGGNWYLAAGNIKTGEVKLLNKFRACYKHAMFSPTDPSLILLDQDWIRDRQTGEYFPINNRIWLTNTECTMFEPLLPKEFYARADSEGAHDYFSADGTYICWSDYFHGAYECNIKTREVTHVWHRPICHSHASRDREMLVGDQSPYSWKATPCRTIFYDRKTNKEIDIFSALPYIDYDRFYHIDPHPQFCLNDSLIVSTTTVMDGRVDVAITPVAPLLKKCREAGEEIKTPVHILGTGDVIHQKGDKEYEKMM